MRPRYVAPLLHAVLFGLTWLAYWAFSPRGLADGPAQYPFALLITADLPFSIVFFGFMFMGSTTSGVLAWLVTGTAWWFLLGLAMERLIARVSKRKRARTQGTG